MAWIATETTKNFNQHRKQERLYFNTKEEAINYTHQQRKHAREHWEVYCEQYE